MSIRTLQLAALVLFAAASVLGQEPEGQTTPPFAATPPEPRLIDAYGRLGHCDWTARLDNFVIELLNHPDAKGYVVSYNSPQKLSFASHQLRSSRYYLVESRGLDPSRLVVVEGGTRDDLREGLTELWFVPAGAELHLAAPAADKYAAGFSGHFDTYAADLNVYQWMAEMSTPDDDIARAEFAAKLKQQPDSVGYFVIRTPKGSAPGAWRRLARRDTQLVSGLGVKVSRLKALDGGASKGAGAEIELWVLPLGAPPPAGSSEQQVDWSLSAAMKLHTYDNSSGQVDESGERWMIANLAEFLHENPRATAWLVARAPQPDEAEAAAGASDEAVMAEETPAPVAETSVAETPEGVAGPEAEEEAKELTMAELAESFKSRLVSEYSIAPDRVVVKEGREVRWSGGRVNIWVVPEKGPRPDLSAPDEDEAEQEELHGVGEAAPAAPPR